MDWFGFQTDEEIIKETSRYLYASNNSFARLHVQAECVFEPEVHLQSDYDGRI